MRDWLEEHGTKPVIPPRKNRKVEYGYDRVIYKQRNVIERMVPPQGLAPHRYPRRQQHPGFHGSRPLPAAVIWWP